MPNDRTAAKSKQIYRLYRALAKAVQHTEPPEPKHTDPATLNRWYEDLNLLVIHRLGQDVALRDHTHIGDLAWTKLHDRVPDRQT